MGLGTRSCALTFAGFALFTLSGCAGGGSAGTSPNPTPTPGSNSRWTWTGGSNVISQAGTYGTLGTAAAGNIPGARYGDVGWTDASGNFWLFGGLLPVSSTSRVVFNDLWKYSAGQWTWMGGSNAANQPGTYGTLGTAAPGNMPGARVSPVSWKDAAGNFWLFGGIGFDSKATANYLNDMWQYSAGQWTWMGGSNVVSQSGTYGTQGIGASTNIPGARTYSASWQDALGNLWLFGGFGYDSAGTIGYLNDLWKYSAGQWTWMGGPNIANQAAVYGTKGTAAPSNIPGSRVEAMSWTDAAGDFWLFGGSPGPQAQFNLLNDLWKYSSGQWTWMGGPNTVNQPGTYGTAGTAAASNIPGARVAGVVWTDTAGNLWLLGGDGYDSAGKLDSMNDLWKFNAGQWTWVSGSNVASQKGTYGSLGTAAQTNVPGARYSEIGWTDTAGNLWLFGGEGYDSTGTQGALNDVWKYEP